MVKWLHQLKTDTDHINHSHLNQNESSIKLKLSNVKQCRESNYYPVVSSPYWVRNSAKVEMEKEQIFLLVKTACLFLTITT